MDAAVATLDAPWQQELRFQAGTVCTKDAWCACNSRSMVSASSRPWRHELWMKALRSIQTWSTSVRSPLKSATYAWGDFVSHHLWKPCTVMTMAQFQQCVVPICQTLGLVQNWYNGSLEAPEE